MQKIASVALLPLYTHHLSPEDYGEVELLVIASGLLAVVLRFELRPALIRAWLDAPGHSRAGLLTGAALPMMAAGLVGALALALTHTVWSEPLLGRPIGAMIVWVLAVGLLCDVAVLPFSAALQAELHSGFIVRLSVSQFLLGTAVTIVTVVGFDAGPAGVVAGSTSAAVLGLAGSAWHCGRLFGWAAPDWRPLPGLMRFSWPLLLAALMYFVVRNGDRFLLSRILTVGDLGLYAVTWGLANMLLTMAVSPILTSLDVWRYRLHAQPNGAVEFADVFRVAIGVICLCAVGLSTIVVDVFVVLADSSYAEVARLAPWLASAVVLQAGYSIVASAFFVTGSTGAWTALFATGAVVQVLASLTTIPLLGVGGAAVGILSANLFLYAGAAVAGRRLWSVPYPHGRAALALILVPLAGAVRASVETQSLIVMLAVGVMLTLGAGVMLLAIGLLRPNDLRKLRRRGTNAN